MKTRIVLALALLVSVGVFSQEIDDMYFRSKDREKQATSAWNKSANNEMYSSNYDSFKKKNFSDPTMLDEYNNPTDSYSARHVNPEFIARSNSAQASADDQNYFMEGYNNIPKGSSFSNPYAWDNSWGRNAWNNPMFHNSWFGPSWGSAMFSPYWGWNNPWANPFWCGVNPGWSMNMGFWGNSWNSGWGWSMGVGYGWGSPFMGSMWGSSWGMWGPSWNMWNPWWNRPYVVVVGDRSRPNFGKRETVSNAGVNNTTTRPVNARPATPTVSNPSNPLGRERTVTTDEYYVRPSRRTYTDGNSSFTTGSPANTGSRVAPGSSGNTGTRSFNSGSGSNTGRSYNNSNSFNAAPSRSSSGMGTMSSPSRSMGSSGSSGVRRGNN